MSALLSIGIQDLFHAHHMLILLGFVGFIGTSLIVLGILNDTRAVHLPKAYLKNHLDVKNAFFNGDLNEKALYGLKQTPCACDTINLLLYVDDIIHTTSSLDSIHRVLLSFEFSMTDLGNLLYFLGIFVARCSKGLSLALSLFAIKILSHAGMESCNPCSTPVDTKSNLGPVVLSLLILYSIVALQAGCLETRRSTSGFCVFLGDNLVSWSCKRQHVVSRPSAEAEYRGVATIVAETA
uniref:Reverse transcriptase Ty1/copia-type domain-containing protein n=1 Tax=Tanacetum cinerariifolium TaxID=118510 RepID=A0A6L2L4M5_TANCI|nr:hypothetical protein [Tanacetum cinerariifolium]